MKTFRRVLLTGLAVLAGLVLLTAVWAFVAFPSAYVTRVLRYGEADVYDYRWLPERTVPASTQPYRFAEDPQPDAVARLFERDAAVDDLDEFLDRNRTQAFLVIQGDTLRYERYFHGAARDSVVTSFSVAKSFASALVGVAIEEGDIGGVTDPITAYLPELEQRHEAFAEITIEDLLRMSSGIAYEEKLLLSGDNAKTYYYPDLRALALEQTKIDGPPGETFLYNNYHPLLLGMILERATGTAVADYLAEKIWQPMGAEYDGSWSLDSEETAFEKMESGINARAIDFAKFASLFLRGGRWNGQQVVPADWVAASTRPDPALTVGEYYPDDFVFADGRGYYGYLWWGMRRADGYDFAAVGNHGQLLYVSPAADMVIVRHGESYGELGDSQGWLEWFYDVASAVSAASPDGG